MATGEKAPGAFRTIGELSAELGVAQHILRYWETKFPQLQPLQRAGNRRYYRPQDVDLARRIHRLLNEEGYTVRGVQKLLAAKDDAPDPNTPRPSAPRTSRRSAAVGRPPAAARHSQSTGVGADRIVLFGRRLGGPSRDRTRAIASSSGTRLTSTPGGKALSSRDGIAADRMTNTPLSPCRRISRPNAWASRARTTRSS